MVLGAQSPAEARVLPPVHPEPLEVWGIFERFGSRGPGGWWKQTLGKGRTGRA